MRRDNWLARISADADVLIDGDFSEEGCFRFLREGFSAAGTEEIHARTIGQVEVGHILNHAEDGHFEGLEHIQAAAGIFQ